MYDIIGATRNFEVELFDMTTQSDSVPYDYYSIMNYNSMMFSRNNQGTITPVGRDIFIGVNGGPSRLDFFHINIMYCGGKQVFSVH